MQNKIFFVIKVLFKYLLPSILLLTSFMSCETTDCFSCPYLISNPHVELGEFEDKHKFAGMHFGLFNDSSKSIDSFTLSFMLYDSDGENPFNCSNCIVSKCQLFMAAGSNIDFVINLDHYISVLPDEPYLVDFIYVREIHYSDGSVWKDPYGMFCVTEEHE